MYIDTRVSSFDYVLLSSSHEISVLTFSLPERHWSNDDTIWCHQCQPFVVSKIYLYGHNIYVWGSLRVWFFFTCLKYFWDWLLILYISYLYIFLVSDPCHFVLVCRKRTARSWAIIFHIARTIYSYRFQQLSEMCFRFIHEFSSSMLTLRWIF